MGKISAKDAMEKYKSYEGNEFFTLKEDMESASVRFLYDKEEDLDIYAVHEVTINGKKRWVECLESGDCPLCVAGSRPRAKIFIQLLDTRDNKVKTWERSNKYVPKMLGIFNKYGPICNRPYDIERHGKPRDKETDYQFYALDKDGKTLADFPQRAELEGDFILVKTAEEMEQLIQQGCLDTNGYGYSNNQSSGRGNGASGTPTRRREKVDDEEAF